MNAKEWIDAVEKHMGRRSTSTEQRHIARMYSAEETDDSAKIMADLIIENPPTKRTRSKV